MAAGDAPSDYYEIVLFNPREAALLAEANGRVSIYDGLEHSVIEQTLDSQFARIDNMMFVLTREIQADGSISGGFIPRCLQRLKSIAMKSVISGNSSQYPVSLLRGSLLSPFHGRCGG
ncbi:MAG: hypothetical protein HPY30_18415 [Gammaproteobacteria bacterium (ex Lamellibrachia satsuma)]|nr:MAG: hypothetical protein HPY30_18415 [Gammaproteobacteria bacterium (ex Lamellibrachia satsuma)]